MNYLFTQTELSDISVSLPSSLRDLLLEKRYIDPRDVLDDLGCRRHRENENQPLEVSQGAMMLLGLALRKLGFFGSTVIFYRAFPDNFNHIAAFIEDMKKYVSEEEIEGIVRQWLIELGREAIKRPDCPDDPPRDEFVLIGFLIEEGLETEPAIRERLGWEDSDVSRARRAVCGLVKNVVRQLHEVMLPWKPLWH